MLFLDLFLNPGFRDVLIVVGIVSDEGYLSLIVRSKSVRRSKSYEYERGVSLTLIAAAIVL